MIFPGIAENFNISQTITQCSMNGDLFKVFDKLFFNNYKEVKFLVVTFVLVLLFVGTIVKFAQFLIHVCLSDAKNSCFDSYTCYCCSSCGNFSCNSYTKLILLTSLSCIYFNWKKIRSINVKQSKIIITTQRSVKKFNQNLTQN